MNLNKIEKVVLTLAFWTQAGDEGDIARWMWFTGDRDSSEENLVEVLKEILNETDAVTLKWDALVSFATQLEQTNTVQ